MADVNDMFNDITKEQSFYKATEKKDITPFAKGEYLGHITKVESKVLDVQGNIRQDCIHTLLRLLRKTKAKTLLM